MLARLAARGLATGNMRSYAVHVVVPPMGDSISEGSLSAILSRAGDLVLENQTIAQIETDKVVIDVKSPVDGKLLGVLVKEEDTVVPGQLIATVDEAPAGTMAGSGSSTAPPPPPAVPAPSSSAASHDVASAAEPDREREPSIRFPPRRTAQGEQISAMPAALAEAALAAAGGASSHGAAGEAGTGTAAAATAPASGSKTSSVVRLDRAPARRPLTDAEMDAIMLGGAMS